jgi:phosphatidylethanolamine-binding protein (PEBP) family uncharacterized protein
MQDELEARAMQSSSRLRVGVLFACVAAAVQLAGCGGGSSATVPASPAQSLPAQPAHVDAVAYVKGAAIPQASYAHWRYVDQRLGVAGDVGHQALGFLITSQWVLDEAGARGLSSSETQVKGYLAGLERKSFPRPGMLHRFLTSSGETEGDLLARARVEMLKASLAAKASAGSAGAHADSVLASFEQGFHRRWRSYTTCKPAYVMEDCSEYRGKGEGLAAGATSHPRAPARLPTARRSSARRSPTSASSTGTTHSQKAPTLNTGQELPTPAPGALTLSSPAFELNGAIPAQYTCDGAGVSPPLRWRNVPPNAAALILYVIDDETPGANGGIRWLVGDIDPKSTGVDAGQTPAGGVVGANTYGHAGYGAICPVHGATTRVEFVMYALSKRIALTAGFQPSEAAYEYGKQKLLLGKAAVTYAGYRRP